MSEDELIVSIVSMGVAGLAWPRYYVSGRRVRHFARSDGARWIVDVTPVIAAAALFAVLKTLAAHDVRDDTAYLGLYFLLGAAWVAIALWPLPLVGVSLRDDVVERRNPSAAYVVAGAVLGLTFAYAGGNIGNGPGWWVVVFSAALATAALFVALAGPRRLDRCCRCRDDRSRPRGRAAPCGFPGRLGPDLRPRGGW